MVKREMYLKKIREFYDSEFIKVLVGMRRTGKSTILKQIISEIESNGISNKNIIYINFESLEYSELTDYKLLYSYIKERITSENKYYIFIDEIQNVESFEKVINSINVDFNVSLFITGSNSNLLSGELATLLAGRYRQFNIYPYNYNEWLESNNNSHNEKLVNKYLMYGGLPQISVINDNQSKIETIRDIMNSILYKDIASRYSIRDLDVLTKIIDYIIQNTSKVISVTSINNYLKQSYRNIKPETISRYIDSIKNAMLIYECKKFNIKGKSLLKSSSNKYYINDIAFKTALNANEDDYSLRIETIVFNHLKVLGYDITYGKIGDYEIDFVATKNIGSRIIKKYIQVAYVLHDEKTIEREFRSFRNIHDGDGKYLISTDQFDMSRDGVKHINLSNFLLDDEF